MLDDSFKDASPKIKETWDQAVKLDKANNYMSAAETYDSLFSMELTPHQQKTVEAAISHMYDRVRRQAARGDSDAKRVLETISTGQK